MAIFYSINCIFIFVLILIAKYQSETNQIGLKSFAAKGKGGSNDELRNLLKRRYITQQTWAFRILLSSIIMSLILGAILILRAILNDDPHLIDSGINLASGVGCSITSFKFYQSASKKVEDLVK